MINRFALSCTCIELDRDNIFGVMLLYILLPPTHPSNEALCFCKPVTDIENTLKSSRLTTFNNVYKNTYDILPPPHLSVLVGLFWDDFPKKINQSESWTNLLTHFQSNLGLLEFLLLY